jgi:DNA-directed RNA polymerase subunit E'/Rpb7
MNELISPYVQLKLYTKVTVKPHQMNTNIYDHIKTNLIRNVEKRCNRDGYIMEIYKIDKFTHGVIDNESFSAAAIYNVEFTAKVCVPILNKQIICTVKKITKSIILAENGPMVIVITTANISNTKFSIDNNSNIKYGTNGKTDYLKINDFIKITITGVTYNSGDDKIAILGYLDDVAAETEIKSFYKNLYNTDTDKNSKKNDNNDSGANNMFI